MKDTSKLILCGFIGGIAALGVGRAVNKLVDYLYLKKRRTAYTEEPVHSKNSENPDAEDKIPVIENNKLWNITLTPYDSYSKIAAEYSNPEEDEKKEENQPKNSDGIYVITPDDFNEMGSYSAATLTCYADGVIADSDDERITDVAELLGDDWNEELIGQYEPDVAYIRNDYLMQDFEIVRDLRTYDDILADKPYLSDLKEDYE